MELPDPPGADRAAGARASRHGAAGAGPGGARGRDLAAHPGTPGAQPGGIAGRSAGRTSEGPAMSYPQAQSDAPLPGQNRLRLLSLGFALCFAVIAGRLADLSLQSGWFHDPTARTIADYRTPRPDIVDRNGVLLASDVRLASLFA